MPKVIICDDHTIVADGLRNLIQSEQGWHVITTVANGRELLETLRLVKPDIVLLDVDMPILNGFETMQLINNQSPDLKVVILTMHDEPSLIKRFIALGAKAFLPKNTNREDLFSTLKVVIEGGTVFNLDERTHSSSKLQHSDKYFHVLSGREIEIVKLIVAGFSNKEIADKLHISPRTVDTHRANIMRKLDVGNVAGLVRYAIRQGMV